MKLTNLFVLLSGVSAVLAPQVGAQSNAETKQEKQAARRAAKEAKETGAAEETGEKKGNSGKKHEGKQAETDPIVYTYTAKYSSDGTTNKSALKPLITANVTMNPDGSWNYSGNVDYQKVGGGCPEFSIVVGVKSSEGTVIAFKHSAALGKGKPGAYSWQRQGKNPTIKHNFKAFAADRDWYSSWACAAQPQHGSGGGGGGNVGQVVGDVVGVLGTIFLSLF